MGTWDVCAWREPHRQELCAGASFGFLTDAMHAADALVATSFSHTCEATCGDWEAVERRRPGRKVKRE
jgi:hypothetical protein